MRSCWPTAGAAAAASTQTWAFLAAMTLVGVGWNLASSGGSALVTAAYRPSERGRVQPVAELTTTTVQVVGSLSAGVLATVQGWHGLGLAVVVASVAMTAVLAATTSTRHDPADRSSRIADQSVSLCEKSAVRGSRPHDCPYCPPS